MTSSSNNTNTNDLYSYIIHTLLYAFNQIFRFINLNMKHRKKAEEHIGRNVLSITIQMRSIVRISYVLKMFLFDN